MRIRPWALLLLLITPLHIRGEDPIEYLDVNGNSAQLSATLPLEAENGRPSLKATLEEIQHQFYLKYGYSRIAEEARGGSIRPEFRQVDHIRELQRELWRDYGKNLGGDYRLSNNVTSKGVTLPQLDAELADINRRIDQAEARKKASTRGTFGTWRDLEAGLVQLRNRVSSLRWELEFLARQIAATPVFIEREATQRKLLPLSTWQPLPSGCPLAEVARARDRASP